MRGADGRVARRPQARSRFVFAVRLISSFARPESNPSMNPAHLHIILNHVPVVGVPIGAALLIYGLLRRSERSNASACWCSSSSLITVPTYLAGQAAEDMVEHLPGVDDDLIHTHEAAATIGLMMSSVLGVLSAAALGLSFLRGRLALPITVLVLLVSLGVSGWLGRVARSHLINRLVPSIWGYS